MKFAIVFVLGLLMGTAALASGHWCARFDGRSVAGLSTIDNHPGYLFRQGCEAAIFEAQTCAISGSFSNGMPCWAAYEGCGNGAWVNARMYDSIEAYVNTLTAQYTATGTCGP